MTAKVDTVFSGVDRTQMRRDGATLECCIVPWDTEIFGFCVAQIDRIEFTDLVRANELLREFDNWCASRDVRLISCRLEHTQLRESMMLEDAGFRFVEMVFSPRLDAFSNVPAPMQQLQVTQADRRDLDRIEGIAYDAFTTGRFLLDWRLAPELSKRRYAYWVSSSFDNPRHTLLKAEFDGDLVGFFIAESRADRSIYWHLTAIAPQWQGQGMGSSVWRTMLIKHRDEGAAYVETTISAHNTAVINLYARLGFSLQPARMTFHRFKGTDA